MNNLQFLAEWDKLLSKIAEVMGVSIDVIQANAGEWLIKFARYQLVDGIPDFILGGIFVGLLFAIIRSVLADENSEERGFIKTFALVLPISTITLFGIDLLRYLASSEIYAIKEVLRLIKYIFY